MKILHNISLKPYNTFGIDSLASSFIEIRHPDELSWLHQAELNTVKPDGQGNILILGGGSNILFTVDYNGLVIKMSISGIDIIKETADEVVVRVGAGENWDSFVEYCIGNGFYGLENLSGIPGNVGAAPIQNIGAYGTEMKEYFDSLEAFEIDSTDTIVYNKNECGFGYRDSIFKNELKGKVIILYVTFRLNKNPEINLSYKVLRERFSGTPMDSLSPSNIREAVLAIRNSKLPDPLILGNAGSFFKNPMVSEDRFSELMEEFPDIAHFRAEGVGVKIAAGWMIDKCGWKGYREGDTGVHKNQALVIVNHGKASGREILDLSHRVRDSVYEKFGIMLEPEVQVIS
jgi:UDP-N-acetylmuramate dehydrogenase